MESSGAVAARRPPALKAKELWVEKFAPRHFAELLSDERTTQLLSALPGRAEKLSRTQVQQFFSAAWSDLADAVVARLGFSRARLVRWAARFAALALLLFAFLVAAISLFPVRAASCSSRLAVQS